MSETPAGEHGADKDAAPNELRVAALAHVVQWYGGPDDDTLPVLRGWLRDLERVFPSAETAEGSSDE